MVREWIILFTNLLENNIVYKNMFSIEENTEKEKKNLRTISKKEAQIQHVNDYDCFTYS